MHRFTLLAAALIALGAGNAEARSPATPRSTVSRQAAPGPQASRRADRAPQVQPCRSGAVVSMYYSTGRAVPRIRTGWGAAAPALPISGPACTPRGNAVWT